MISRQKAGKSGGVRDVIKLPSTTTSSSTYVAPAWMMSSLDVADARGPLALENAGRSQHPAGVADRGHDFAASLASRTMRTMSSLARMWSGA